MAASTRLNALPIEPTAKQILQEIERPKPTFIPARIGWDSSATRTANLNLTFEQYGPQATARAVRASLWVALTPDPIAMAALLFCAFALRWMRTRKEQERVPETNTQQPTPEVLLPKAA
jgi:hypothetical protein